MPSDEKNSVGKEKPLLLFSPLDWGLGHTTRSIPLIKELLAMGNNVIVACNSTQKAVLEKEIPSLGFVLLDGYKIRYGRNLTITRLLLLLQVKKILTKVKMENRWLTTFLKENRVSGVISDNRYGLYSDKVPCIFITHQLYARSGYGRIIDQFIQQYLYRYINKFSACWVPDIKKGSGMAGRLSHPARLPQVPIQYLGCLSRFENCSDEKLKTEKKQDRKGNFTDLSHPGSTYMANVNDFAGRDSTKHSDTLILSDNKPSKEFKNPLLVILSGPEPQRSVLENIIITQLEKLNQKAVLVRGLPAGKDLIKQIPGVTIINYADSVTLNQLICDSELIICRSGYTTIMDMLKLRKKMVMIPTPGQSEQEYLAVHLHSNKLALAISQKKFSVISAIQQSETFDYHYLDADTELYKEVIRQSFSDISHRREQE